MQDKFKMLKLENVKKKRGYRGVFGGLRLMHFSFSFIQVYYYRMKIMKNKLTNSQTNKITAIS